MSYQAFATGDFWQPPSTMSELRDLAARVADRWTILWTDVTTPDVAPVGHRPRW